MVERLVAISSAVFIALALLPCRAAAAVTVSAAEDATGHPSAKAGKSGTAPAVKPPPPNNPGGGRHRGAAKAAAGKARPPIDKPTGVERPVSHDKAVPGKPARASQSAPSPGESPLLAPAVVKSPNGPPAIIASTGLRDFSKLPPERQQLIETAIAVARDSPWLTYLYGSADPARGGFDCSGAMFYVLVKCGLAPPRTSAAQYLWLREHQRLHLVPPDATTPAHPSLAWLQPGDLLFWSRAQTAAVGLTNTINHVAMYLGRETRDDLQVMINSTDGRSYRGTRANGYGVYDFRVASAGSSSRLVGYGTPPGLPEIPPPAVPGP